MRAVVLTVLLFPCSKMGKLIVLLLGDATSIQLSKQEEDINFFLLPSLKIHCSWSGDLSDLFSEFFKTGSKDFKDVGLAFPEVLSE